MQVSVCYSEPGQQAWLRIEVADDATAAQAIEQSGILRMFPSIDLEAQRIGVFGKFIQPEAALRAGDRIEIYRPITCDPTTVPRRQFADDDE